VNFNLTNALYLVEASDVVNRDLNTISAELQERFGLLRTMPFDCQDTQAFLSANENILLLVFRGTTTWRHWLQIV
jgi:hypothetical protein